MAAILNLATYGLIAALWGAILAVYLRHRQLSRSADPVIGLVVSVLALDAFKSVAENVYFGLLWGSRNGLFGKALGVLSHPAPMTAIKLLNLAVAVIVLFKLARVWLPRQLLEREEELVHLEMLVRNAQDSEASFRAAFNTSPDAMCICRLDDGINIAVNPGYCRMSGWAEDDILGKNSLSLNLWVDAGQRTVFADALRKEGEIHGFEAAFRRKDGSVFPGSLNARRFTIGDKDFFLAVIHDLTSARHAAKVQNAIYRIAEAVHSRDSLREMLAVVHAIVGELMPMPNFFIALHDPRTGLLTFPYFVDEQDDVPTSVEAGRSLSAYVLRTGEALLVSDESKFDELVRKGEVGRVGPPSVSWLGVPLKTDARVIGVLVAQSYTEGVVYSEEDKEILQFVSTQVAQAIERKSADELLRANERRFRALIENTQDCIMVLSPEGNVTYRSSNVARVLGPEAMEHGRAVMEYLHPDDVEMSRETWRKVLATPSQKISVTVRTKHGNGSWRTLDFDLVNLIADAAVCGVVCNFRDVTERKHIEAQLMAADRMVSIGTLAAGVAHEINNPLAYVIANLELIGDKALAADTQEALKAAQDGAERVRQIVRDLKTFSRSDDQRVYAVEVHAVLDAAANIASNEIRHRARLLKEYGVEVPKVAANESRLGQVVLNLLVNAAQAMPDGEAERNRIVLRTRAEGETVVVEVQDTGQGISPEHRARLFDPFFTTKPVGVGTGLGLYISQQILSSMGGSISVESEPCKGSTFRLRIPIATGSARATQRPPPVPTSARARILAIDDEPMIGRVVKSALASHDVTEMTSAIAAFERIQAGERFDLIICDLMMPHMTGMDFHAALQEVAPEQAARMVFLTGGAFTARAREFLDTVPAPRVDKPFAINQMRTLVDERLRVLRARA